MFDPLTQQRDATLHSHKSVAFDAIAAPFDAVIAMDASLANCVRTHHPKLATLQIPYLVAASGITTPLAESERSLDVIFLGGQTARRAVVQQAFAGRPLHSEFIWSGPWGAARDEKRRRSRISLNIHADQAHTYFDQFRTLEAWAAGTVVVTETTGGLEPWAIVPGIHLAMAGLDDLAEVCAELIADIPQRAQMIKSAHELLRTEFSPQRWRQDMLSVLENIA